jgi:hypothetical protein
VETVLFRARRSLAANLEEPTRTGRTSRLGLGSFVTFLKSLLTGGSAAKVAVGAIAVTATIAAAGSAEERSAHARVLPAVPLVVRTSENAPTASRPAVGSVTGRAARHAGRPQHRPGGRVKPGDLPVQTRSEIPVAGPTNTTAPSSRPSATPTASVAPAPPTLPLPSAQLPPPPVEVPSLPSVELPPPPAVQLPPSPVDLPQVSVPTLPEAPLPQLPSLP